MLWMNPLGLATSVHMGDQDQDRQIKNITLTQKDYILGRIFLSSSSRVFSAGQGSLIGTCTVDTVSPGNFFSEVTRVPS